MAPREHSYRQPAAEPHAQYPSPFQQSSPDDFEVSGSEVDSDNQPIMSHLLRRSRSLTDANFTLELQPSSRRRSFFSKRRPKATQEQPALSTTNPGRSFTTQGRSLSGLLPNQALVSEPDSKPPTGSKRTDSKSFRTKGDSDTDARMSRPKSARWWSWGSSSKGLKPDGEVLPLQGAGSPAGSNSRPTSLDLQLQQPQPNRATSSAALAQTSPLAQPGCMSMFSAAPGQPEKPVSEVPQTGKHLPCLLLLLIHLLLSPAYLHELIIHQPTTESLPPEATVQAQLHALSQCSLACSMRRIDRTKSSPPMQGKAWLLSGHTLAFQSPLQWAAHNLVPVHLLYA